MDGVSKAELGEGRERPSFSTLKVLIVTSEERVRVLETHVSGCPAEVN